MKKPTTTSVLLTAIAFCTLYIGCDQTTTISMTSDTSALSRLPQDVLESCTITQREFNSWFNDDAGPSENGIIDPPNGIRFKDTNNCEFYKWSWQMFAWIVSTAKTNETVMAGFEFYTVSPENSSDERTLIPHVTGQPLRASSSITQAGPNGLPTIRDNKGNLLEVEKHDPAVKPMLLTGVRVHSVEMDADGKPVFKDQSKKVINNPKVRTKAKGKVVKEFKTSNGISVFAGEDGVVESEQGQAGGSGGLMSQNKSIVYYISMVNDVYAVFLSADKTDQISGYQFPTTPKQLDTIMAIAKANSIPLIDSVALAVEIKTSWVEATTLTNVDNYITIDAIIPTYDKKDSLLWTPTGERQAKLAMLGMHVVGSTLGHPEMIWATFEHQENSPFTAYNYLNKNNVIKRVQAESQSKWTLSSAPADTVQIQNRFTASGDTLIAETDSTIGPSNISLIYPWGSKMGVSPNAEAGSSAASNSEVISINNVILKKLVGNDTRKNYLMIGSTWTEDGVAPSGNSYSTDPNDPHAAVGTSLLANSSMETYHQDGTTSCFFCHNNHVRVGGLKPASLSHVYDKLQPLPDFKVVSDK